MEYISKTLDFHVKEPSVISFGKFDGLHRGHEFLMEKQIEQSNLHGYKRIIFTFDIPPKSEVLGVESKVIITNDEKEYVFEKSGIDYLIECPFVPQVMTMEADAFVRWIVKSLNVKCIIVGDDFRFGHNRAGDHRLLSAMAGELGYELIVVDKIKDGDRDISSTYIREEIAAGHIKKANELLGYPFFIKGRVVHGRALGRTIGIPTVNLSVPHDKLLPPKGVYMSRVLVRDNWYLGVTNICLCTYWIFALYSRLASYIASTKGSVYVKSSCQGQLVPWCNQYRMQAYYRGQKSNRCRDIYHRFWTGCLRTGYHGRAS